MLFVETIKQDQTQRLQRFPAGSGMYAGSQFAVGFDFQRKICWVASPRVNWGVPMAHVKPISSNTQRRLSFDLQTLCWNTIN